MRRALAGIASRVGTLIEVGEICSYNRPRDGNTIAQVENAVDRPTAQGLIRKPIQVYPSTLANGQIIGCLPCELVLNILRTDRMFILQVFPVLNPAGVRTNKP